MTFLNLVLLGGILAAAIPILVHLLSRRRFKVVPWGAMMFLEDVMRTNRRRIRLEQLLLLLVRCALPVVLALCMARPVLTGLTGMTGHAPSSLVVLLDNSFSMQAGDALQTGFSRATAFVDRVLERATRGSDVAVVGMAGSIPALAEPTSDRALVRRELAGLDAGYAAADVAGALDTASGYFASRMHHADRELLVLSDFQRSSWGREDAPERRRMRELLEAHPIPPRRVLVSSAGPGEENVCVRSLELPHPLLGVGQKVTVRAHLANLGRRAASGLRVYFRVDGEEQSVARLSLEPGETGQLLFTHRFASAGSHILEVFSESDRLKTDNAGYAAVQVLDQLPVLLINGDPSADALQGETGFLERALQPFTANPNGLRNLIDARVTEPDDLTTAMLELVRVVILANVSRLGERQESDLRSFVRQGGGMLVFPGDRADLDWYHRRLGDPADPLLPLGLGDLAGGADAAPATVAARHYGHPALDLFNDPQGATLGAFRIRHWYRLVPLAGAAADAVSVPAHLDSGDPFLAERTYGKGRVIQACLPADADWSNLPLRSAYLPLMQELVTYLASQVYPPRNLSVGQTLAALLPAETIQEQATVLDPAGRQHRVRITEQGGKGLAEFRDVRQPGVYLLVTPSGETIHYAVETPFDESRLDRLSDEELLAVGEELGAVVVASWDDYHDQDQRRRFGREIWKPLLWCVLLLLFVEIAMARRFQGRVA